MHVGLRHLAFQRVIAAACQVMVFALVSITAGTALCRGGLRRHLLEADELGAHHEPRTSRGRASLSSSSCHQTTCTEQRGGDAREPGDEYSTTHIFPLGCGLDLRGDRYYARP